MKQILAIGILTLLATLTEGCTSESDRMADMAEEMVHSQNKVNSNIVRTNEKFVELSHDLQRERAGLQNERMKLNDQFGRLEQDRRELHRQRRSEVAWSDSFQFLAIVIAAIMPLFLIAFLIWASTQSSVKQEEVNSILIHELVSAEPLLIVRPNLPLIEPPENDELSRSANETNTRT